MIFMDEKWTNFILNVGSYHYFCKNLNKKNRVEIIYIGFFQNNSTHEMFKLHLHTSYFFNMKYIHVLQHVNHIEC
jgi:hypothetical protein